jgi:hypothetical protein
MFEVSAPLEQAREAFEQHLCATGRGDGVEAASERVRAAWFRPTDQPGFRVNGACRNRAAD